MKTTRFVCVAFATIALTASVKMTEAQTTVTDNGSLFSSFGVKGGLNISNLYADDVDDRNAKAGFQLGFFAKAPITKNFSIQPELLYSQKGAQLQYDNAFTSGKASFNLHYLEMPVLGVFNLGRNFNVHGGVYISYLLGADVVNKASNEGFNFEDELKKENFESIDYGLVGGVGLDGRKIGVGVRYNYGLKPVGKERNFLGQTYRIPDAMNSTLQVYLSLAL